MRLEPAVEPSVQTSPNSPPDNSRHASQPDAGATGAPSMTSTLAILPSSPLDTHSTDSRYAPGLSYQPPLVPLQSSSQKPRLTLNTSSCSWRVPGRGNTGLRLDKVSASSPTVQNTYKNGYETVRAPETPITFKDRRSPANVTRVSSSAPSTPHPRVDSPASSSTSTSLPSLYSGSSQSSAVDLDLDASKAALFNTEVPYARNPGLHPILSNTPLPTKHVCTPRTAARKHQRRTNSVSFRPALTEEIHTTNYVAKHSDLLEKPGATPKSPRGAKRESPDAECRSSSDHDSSSSESDGHCPKTPVAGRHKRRREWVWTLGSVDGVPCRTPDSPDSTVANPSWASGEHPVLEAPRLAVPTPRRRAT